MRQPAASQRGTLTEPAKTSTPSTRDRAVRAPALGEPPALHVSACEVLEFVPDAVVGVDGNGCIAFVNIQAENMFGYERREMLGKRVELLLPDHLKELHVQRRTSYHANPIARPMKARRDLVARRKDGSEFPVEISLGKLRAFGGVQVISAIRDVTERARLEQERERLLSVADRSRAEAQRTAEAVGRLQALTDAALTISRWTRSCASSCIASVHSWRSTRPPSSSSRRTSSCSASRRPTVSTRREPAPSAYRSGTGSPGGSPPAVRH